MDRYPRGMWVCNAHSGGFTFESGQQFSFFHGIIFGVIKYTVKYKGCFSIL